MTQEQIRRAHAGQAFNSLFITLGSAAIAKDAASQKAILEATAPGWFPNQFQLRLSNRLSRLRRPLKGQGAELRWVFGRKRIKTGNTSIRTLEGIYVDDLGRVQPWRAHYDQLVG